MAVAKDKGGEPGKSGPSGPSGPVKDEGKGQQVIRNPDADPIGQHWPRQSLFVGQNHCVEWNGGGGKFAAHQDAVNEADVDVAMGRNPIESFASVLAGEIPNLSGIERKQAEELLTAFGLGVYSEASQPNGDVALETAVHRESFESLQGGTFTDKRKNSDGIVSEQDFAAPNFYESRDISLMITNTHRSTRHGEDGLHNQDGLLHCRITETAFENYRENKHLQPSMPNHGGIPPECLSIALEVSIFGWLFENYVSADDFEPVIRFTRGESSDHLQAEINSNPTLQATQTFLMNCLRSPVALNVWSQAWVPLFADCTYELADLSVDDFEFMDLDYELKEDVWNTIRGGTYNLSWGQVRQVLPLFAKAGSVLSRQVNSYQLNEKNEAPLGMEELAIQLEGYDVLSTVLDINDAIESFGHAELMHCGLVRLKRLLIVDAFGNHIEFDPKQNPPQVAMSLESSDDSEFAILRPRSVEPMRVLLTLVDGADGTAQPGRAGYDVSPVSAFLLPDHIEWAMEVFSSQGVAAGQLRVAQRDIRLGGFQTGRLLWDPAPGVETELGASPDLGNAHANGMLCELINISLQDEVRLQEAKRTSPGAPLDWPEGVLSSLMRAIDTTLWNTDPLGKSPEDLPTLFSGRPLAVVRAELSVELNSLDPQRSVEDTVVEVKLGDMERLVDGLLGYYLDNDYTRFYSVLTDHVLNDVDNNLNHSYLQADSTVDVRIGQRRQLTLIMDPQSDVHVTTGVLPQKEIGLMREHKQQQLALIAPTYRAGPMLVDPTTVRMPVPDLILPTEWTWLTKKNSNEWAEDPIVPEDGKPHLPPGRIAAWNGWLKLQKKDD
jgi:hypothetical protein